MMIVIEGENQILGRAATRIAKELLNGQDVAVVNAEKMVISGSMPPLLAKYQQRRNMKNKACPENSPHWPRRPDLFVRRIVRGMLPFDKPRGKAAFKKLSVYLGVPEELKANEKIKPAGADLEKLNTKYQTVALLCNRLGYME